jgi:hypothetical protein
VVGEAVIEIAGVDGVRVIYQRHVERLAGVGDYMPATGEIVGLKKDQAVIVCFDHAPGPLVVFGR